MTGPAEGRFDSWKKRNPRAPQGVNGFVAGERLTSDLPRIDPSNGAAALSYDYQSMSAWVLLKF